MNSATLDKANDCNIVCGVISPGPTGRVMSYDLKPGNIIISLPDNKARVHITQQACTEINESQTFSFIVYQTFERELRKW